MILLLALLVLWVLQMALSIGNQTEVLSQLQHLQKQCKDLPLWGCAAFLHNVIIAAQHYNATLCKEAWGKKLPAQVTECTCYCINNCDGNFFRSVGKEWQLKCKTFN